MPSPPFENFSLDTLNNEQKPSVKKPVNRADQKPVNWSVNRRWFWNLPVWSGRENPDRFHLWVRRQRSDLSVFESSCYVPTSNGGGFTLSLYLLSVKGKAVNINFCGLWFEPTGNQTRVYRFSSRRSIHSTTDRLNMDKIARMEYGKIVFHFILYHASRQHKLKWNSLQSKLDVFFTLNTISCFILSRDVKKEAGSGSG